MKLDLQYTMAAMPRARGLLQKAAAHPQGLIGNHAGVIPDLLCEAGLLKHFCLVDVPSLHAGTVTLYVITDLGRELIAGRERN